MNELENDIIHYIQSSPDGVAVTNIYNFILNKRFQFHLANNTISANISSVIEEIRYILLDPSDTFLASVIYYKSKYYPITWKILWETFLYKKGILV
jgi:hypothetical protein